jgi:SAM-dependent methyltransferase
MHLQVIREIWNAYGAAGGDERIRSVVRYMLFSWTSLLPFFPPKGSVLDVGCGNGLLFYLLDRQAPGSRQLVGVDHDAARVAIARALRIPGAEFRAEDVAAAPAEGYDAASVNVTRPRWKYWVAYLQELLMVNGLRLTKGATICFQSLEDYVALVEDCGATVTLTRRLDGGRPYAHAVLIARKRAASD